MSKQKGTYIVRVNCTGYKDIKVEAGSGKEAIKIAVKKFQCDGSSEGEFCEFIEKPKKNQ